MLDRTPEVKLTVDDAIALATRALQRIGCTREEGEVVATHLVDSELCGYPALGLSRILSIAEHPRMKARRTSIATTHETPTSAVIDGGNNLGFVAIREATRIAIHKAAATRFAVVATHNTYMTGRVAHYLEMTARAGFVAIHFASGAPNVVPPGSTQALLGTNPLGIGLPCEPDPYVMDLSTAALNAGDVALAKRMATLLPPGTAVDGAGEATQDPAAVQAGGGIVPFGGHKGYALSLAIQAMCLLCTAATGNAGDSGYLQIVFDPGLLVPAAQYKQALAALIDSVRSASRVPGAAEVRIPSRRAFAQRERARVMGITLDRRLHDRIAAL